MGFTAHLGGAEPKGSDVVAGAEDNDLLQAGIDGSQHGLIEEGGAHGDVVDEVLEVDALSDRRPIDERPGD